MRIYVASSWRNAYQPEVVRLLRAQSHLVYDFRNPTGLPGDTGFSWKEISPDWDNWTTQQYREALKHPIAEAAFAADMRALDSCQACLLVLPSGRSASFEFGYAVGNSKYAAVFSPCKAEPELMYAGNPILASYEELTGWSQSLRQS